jgi:16S rRNA (uracil1498-N3)-methyltransferase
MRISRIYINHPLAIDDTLQLDDDSAHYLRNVLRIKKNHQLILFNGEGGEYQGEVIEVSRKIVLIKLCVFNLRSAESSLNITLGIGISRGERMDFAIQKSVELGVQQISPLLTEHCVVQLKDDKKAKKIQHWQKISQNSAEQSGRTLCPKINSINHFDTWVLQQLGLKIFLDPFAKQTLTQLSPLDNQVTLLAGPEGGFSNTERETAINAGFTPVRLGPRILRTETAALSALTAVQLLWGDFNV